MVYKRSIENAIKELEAIKYIYNGKEGEDREEFLEEALEEVSYNLGLAQQGVEYKSDEYQYLSESFKEVLGDYNAG